ncbi:DMT family transporter [Phycicoccus sp. MAQZ13P-2]|uniref:EamA family transporter n=1 Tax=Phycicoccus mangrovi TaxID=2840470 RepID=UPI001C005E09|nr:DMT family transporter [Phycicoccus mangrovi]MBT9255143.1 DMT family transporter [Phycicoccus mangrovi]MBT9274127.1 DMT family transporter [Phycicoccus mangrovi]
MVEAVRRHVGVGLVALLLSSAAFGTSGPFAKSLIGAGWSPGAVVLLRIAGAAVLLLPVGLWQVRHRLREVRRELPLVGAYGCLAVAAAQLGYFQAVERLAVGVALLIEYLGIVLVVLWVWLLTRRAPHRLTGLGIVLALTGLALVLDVTGQRTPDLVGVAWGLLAAAGLAGHYVLAARETTLPPFTFAALGLSAGAVVLAVLGVTGVLPMEVGAGRVEVAAASVPAWAALAELVVVAAAVAYVLGVLGARHLGSTLASFVGLTEVLFAVLFAWLVLGELPGPWQLVGGLVVLAGVAAVRVGERRQEEEGRRRDADFDLPSPVA